MKILNFINQNDNWKELIQLNPYCITVKQDVVFGKEYTMLSYNQVLSDFKEEMVRECRGLILDSSNNPVSIPFYKFGNYGESYVPDIDWQSAYVTEKVDGSIIKVVRVENNLLISTNGTIDASKAMVNDMGMSFLGLFKAALLENGLSIEDFTVLVKPDITYMFELVSPYNRIVVSYEKPDVKLIGLRDNKTLQEINVYESSELSMIKRPKVYSFSSLSDCVKNAQVLSHQEEGYVVFDKSFNRVKVKSPSYVALHYLRGNGAMNYARIIDVIKLNEDEELLSYFPEYTDVFANTKRKIESLCRKLDSELEIFRKEFVNLPTRKDKALYIQSNFTNHYFGYANIDGETKAKEWLLSLKTEVIKEILEQNDE